jgi:hypothetical protein
VSKLTLGLNCAGGGGELRRLVLATDDLILVAGRAELERELPTLSLELLGTNWTLGRRPASSPPAVLRVGRRHAGMKLGLLPSSWKAGTERSGRVVEMVRGELAAEPPSGVEKGEGDEAMRAEQGGVWWLFGCVLGGATVVQLCASRVEVTEGCCCGCCGFGL